MYYLFGRVYYVRFTGMLFLLTSALTLFFYSLIARLVLEKQRSTITPSASSVQVGDIFIMISSRAKAGNYYFRLCPSVRLSVRASVRPFLAGFFYD
jgi:hypothetical protein